VCMCMHATYMEVFNIKLRLTCIIPIACQKNECSESYDHDGAGIASMAETHEKNYEREREREREMHTCECEWA
jgi:hypothetical protein